MADKLLLIDDEPDIRTIGSLALSSVGGFDVALAASGAEGLVMALRSAPDVILLDVMMPAMDGPTTLARLRAEPTLERVPVIFMTAKSDRRVLDRLLDLGAAGVILKPYDPMKLAAEVRRIVAALDAHARP